tara:strand:+ start:919 stop:1428 length:510 start_codon:yes stop_codon:yes gene_type:complete
MAENKIQGQQALAIFPSESANIPYPVITHTGVSGTVASFKLISSAGNPFTDPKTIVYAGDIIANTTTGKSCTVLTVDSGAQLSLNENLFPTAGQNYIIYSASSVLNLQDANNGCVLYIGTTGNVTVDTVAGSTATKKVLFSSVPVGFFPIQVTKVYEEGTTASKIVAIW